MNNFASAAVTALLRLLKSVLKPYGMYAKPVYKRFQSPVKLHIKRTPHGDTTTAITSYSLHSSKVLTENMYVYKLHPLVNTQKIIVGFYIYKNEHVHVCDTMPL